MTPASVNEPETTTRRFLSPGAALTVAEVVLVFVVFAIQGARPVPEVNEPYYISKAIHFWNPEAIAGDAFLNSSDTHTTFYFSLGWLAVFLPPVAVAWGGRLITWALLAWSWQRLSRAVVPWRWAAVWTAAVFVCLIEHGHMAGEWLIGGVEAKGIAYVLTFLGLEALARGRFPWVWPLLGAAAAFHVLVGGWAVVSAGMAWLLLGRHRPTLRSMLPWLALGFLLSLPGLIPSLLLTRGADPATVAFTNQLYVFVRLGHHLDPAGFPLGFVVRFLALTAVWGAMCYAAPGPWAARRINAFVGGTLVLSLMGVVIAVVLANDPARAAGLLRFYWFRLSDITVPMGIALAGPRLLVVTGAAMKQRWPHHQRLAMIGWAVVTLLVLMVAALVLIRFASTVPPGPCPWQALIAVVAGAILGGVWYVERNVLPFDYVRGVRQSAIAALAAALLVIAPAVHLGHAAVSRARPSIPRADRLWDYWAWIDACRWIDASGEVPADARFITPLMGQTFKWYAQRSEVVTWKDIPQDAESIDRWWHTVLDIYQSNKPQTGRVWIRSLARVDSRRLKYLGEKYDAPYLITYRWPRKRNFRVLYENRTYIVYRMDMPPAPPAWLVPDAGEMAEPPQDLDDYPAAP